MIQLPAAYAHITLVNVLKEPRRLQRIPRFPKAAIPAILDYLKFCELGAVSPDYPYLAVWNSDAKKWADEMHYNLTGAMIHAGIQHLQSVQGEAKRKGLAWLLGYAAHVATDVSIHPVVQLKVGPYQGNEKAHRICEMHQDAYIFDRMNLGDIGVSEFLESGIASCCHPQDESRLDPDIEVLWAAILREVHPESYAANPPDVDEWHKGFGICMGDVAEEGNRLFPFARHVAAGLGLVYPAREEIDRQFIDNLKTPIGTKHYNEVFDFAIRNVGEVWQVVASAVIDRSLEYQARIGQWNLDTGLDDKDKSVFWGVG